MTETFQKRLTDKQLAQVEAEMIVDGMTVRFLRNGRALNIETGESSPGYVEPRKQKFYYNFSRETAQKIAKWLGARAVFS